VLPKYPPCPKGIICCLGSHESHARGECDFKPSLRDSMPSELILSPEVLAQYADYMDDECPECGGEGFITRPFVTQNGSHDWPCPLCHPEES